MNRGNNLQVFAIVFLSIGARFIDADDLWSKFDKDSDGCVTKAELVEGFKKESINLTELQVESVFAIADYNNDGKITKLEFETKVIPYKKFRAFDKDNNCFITKEELPAGFQLDNITLKTEIIEEIFKIADESNDGKINFREFVYKVYPYYKFAKFDTDGTGKISKDELKAGFAAEGVKLEGDLLDHVFKVADINSDGQVNYTEFVTRITAYPIFAKFDKDNSGTVCASELVEGFKYYGITITEAQGAEIIYVADTNNDGKISFYEYLFKVHPYFKFVKFDKDHTGTLTKAELEAGLKFQGFELPTDKFNDIMDVADLNKDGAISYAEFVNRINPIFVFQRFDKNRNGCLDKQELKEGFALHTVTLDQAQLDALFEEADSIKKDGSIDYREFFYKAFPYFNFRRFDGNKNGFITKEELGEGLKFVGIDLESDKVKEVFDLANTNGDEHLCYKEYVNVIESFIRFRKFDKNKNGEIDADELVEGAKAYGKKLSADEAKKLIDEADEGSKDGKLTFKEYLKIDKQFH